jgi:hypothetical protein
MIRAHVFFAPTQGANALIGYRFPHTHQHVSWGLRVIFL